MKINDKQFCTFMDYFRGYLGITFLTIYMLGGGR